MEKFDVIIIGAGIGGLIAANFLVMKGYKVCVLEKNKQIGGALQVYVRNRVIFDTGVHYLGGLDPGQNLYQIFKYIDILDKLKLKRMPDIFDTIIIGDDEKEYKMAQGYERFIEVLSADFPGEEKAIRSYCDKVREICFKFPLYNLRSGGSYEEKAEVMSLNAKDSIASFTSNKKLQAVLGGNNLLYAGQPQKTPFYVHALILNSYIESSWKCMDGGSQISKAYTQKYSRVRRCGENSLRGNFNRGRRWSYYPCEIKRWFNILGRFFYLKCPSCSNPGYDGVFGYPQ